MSSKYYDHYLLLSKENLISMIEKQAIEINQLKQSLEEIKESRNNYYEYNKFHMEEITRLDKKIGEYKKKDKSVKSPLQKQALKLTN